MKNITRTQYQAFPYHLVEPSPWPILTSFAMLTLTVSAVLYFHGFVSGGELLTLGFILVSGGMTLWFRDVITEGTKKIETIMATTKALSRDCISLLLLITLLYLTCYILLGLDNYSTNLMQYDCSTTMGKFDVNFLLFSSPGVCGRKYQSDSRTIMRKVLNKSKKDLRIGCGFSS